MYIKMNAFLFLVLLSICTFNAFADNTPTLTNSVDSEAKKTNKKKSLSPASTIEIEYQNEKNLFLPRFKNYIALYEPTYVLPYYYTASPDFAVYPPNQIPGQQTLKRNEFKAQLSVYLPLVKNLFYNKNVSINITYTQLIYWQLYTQSPWFRESDYEPTLSLRGRIVRNFFGELILNHQSNGRGGTFERSWNRLIGRLEFATPNFFYVRVVGFCYSKAQAQLYKILILHIILDMMILFYPIVFFISL